MSVTIWQRTNHTVSPHSTQDTLLMLQDHQSNTSPPAHDAEALLQAELREHRAVFEDLTGMLSGPFLETLGKLETGLRRGGKLMLFGNGGSAADAQHLAAELT